MPDTDPPTPPSPKPGIYTTEFWLTALTSIIGLLLASGLVHPGTPFDKAIGFIVTALAGLGYTVSRGIVKAAAAKTVVATALMFAVLMSAGCLAPVNATPQQKLDNARQIYANANNVINILIGAGYIGKNDPALKEAIFQTSAQIKSAFATAQGYLDANNTLTAQFWIDQGMGFLATFLQFQAEGEAKHKASNPATRPALPAKVTRGEMIYGGTDHRTCGGDHRAVDSRGYGGQGPWRYAYG